MRPAQGMPGSIRLRLGMAAALLAIPAALIAIDGATPAPTAATKASSVQTGVHYDGAEGPVLDVYRPPKGSFRPAVVVVHGGGWIGGSRKDTEGIAQSLAGAGFVAFNVDYTLAGPGAPGFRIQPRELRTAVRFIRANASDFGVNPARIGIFGSSAGGHLAALVGTAARGSLARGARLRAVVTWSGPLALSRRALRRSPHLRKLTAQFLGCRRCPRRARDASPVRRVSPDDPPTLIVNSTNEIVPAIHARWMARRLKAAGVAYRLLMIPGSLHSPDYEARTLRPSIRFLRRHLH